MSVWKGCGRSSTVPRSMGKIASFALGGRRPTFAAGLAAILAVAVTQATAQGFKFSQEGDADRPAESARAERIAARLSTPCRQAIKDKKIMLVIGEQQTDGQVIAQQDNYGPHFQVINAR